MAKHDNNRGTLKLVEAEVGVWSRESRDALAGVIRKGDREVARMTVELLAGHWNDTRIGEGFDNFSRSSMVLGLTLRLAVPDHSADEKGFRDKVLEILERD